MSTINQVIPSVETVQEFVESLKEGERTTFGDLIKKANLTAQDFSKFTSWSDTCYTRNCIAHNNEFELILLCWQPGQETPIHDHGGEECWVKVIDGEFTETIYRENQNGDFKQGSQNQAKAGDCTYMIDFMGYHNLKNESKTKSLSLHLYAKPIGACNIYNEETKETFRKELAYDKVFDAAFQ